jgi:hypothetical protein
VPSGAFKLTELVKWAGKQSRHGELKWMFYHAVKKLYEQNETYAGLIVWKVGSSGELLRADRAAAFKTWFDAISVGELFAFAQAGVTEWRLMQSGSEQDYQMSSRVYSMILRIACRYVAKSHQIEREYSLIPWSVTA